MKIATLYPHNIPKKKLIMFSVIAGVVALSVIGALVFFLVYGENTQAEETVPQNVSIDVVDGQQAQVKWSTGSDTLAVIEYGTSPDPATFSEFAFSELETSSHAVRISGLKPETTYYFRIQSGDDYYDNNGQLWSFTTPAGGDTPAIDPDASPLEPDAPFSDIPTPSSSASPSASIVPTPTITATPSATLTPTPTRIMTPTPTSTISGTLTPTSATTASSSTCKSNNCTTILGELGTLCNTQDYVRCLLYANITITQGPTNTPTPVPVSDALKNSCSINYFQANSCTSWIWDGMDAKEQVCEDTFTRYFVQCKGTSFTSSDSAQWYCNQTFSTNEFTLPCGSAPTPIPGQAVFCRVRAETDVGGEANATDWIYTNTTCSQYSSVADDSNCLIGYLQANTCTSWNWDPVNSKDPRCAESFDHYFFQCTDGGNFTSADYWYCNSTFTDNFMSLPCTNEVSPDEGDTYTCRVRAEDAYSTAEHAGDWVTTTYTCPTNTPTPSPTNTPTPTP